MNHTVQSTSLDMHYSLPCQTGPRHIGRKLAVFSHDVKYCRTLWNLVELFGMLSKKYQKCRMMPNNQHFAYSQKSLLLIKKETSCEKDNGGKSEINRWDTIRNCQRFKSTCKFDNLSNQISIASDPPIRLTSNHSSNSD